jgi:hypothetical protein
MSKAIGFGTRVKFTYPTGRIACGTVQGVDGLGEIRIKYDPEMFEKNRSGLTDRSRPIPGSGGYVTVEPGDIVEVL